MRLSTLHLIKVRDRLFPDTGETAFGHRILADIIDYRRLHRLDEKFPYEPGSLSSPKQFRYELNKLMAIFELLRQDPTVGDQLEFIEELKTRFPPEEVDEILEEYFPELRVPHRPQ